MSRGHGDATAHTDWDPDAYQWDSVALTATRKPRRGTAGMRMQTPADTSSYTEYLGEDVPQLMSRPPVGALSKAQRLICQIQGCNRSLQNSKLYYQRFKLCEDHLKAPAISIDGVLSRLCQQCGRFHELSAFEGKKRTCRSQLDRIRKSKEQRKQRNVGSSDSPNRDADGEGEDTMALDTRAAAMRRDGRRGGSGAGEGGGSSNSRSSGLTSSGSANAGQGQGSGGAIVTTGTPAVGQDTDAGHIREGKTLQGRGPGPDARPVGSAGGQAGGGSAGEPGLIGPQGDDPMVIVPAQLTCDFNRLRNDAVPRHGSSSLGLGAGRGGGASSGSGGGGAAAATGGLDEATGGGLAGPLARGASTGFPEATQMGGLGKGQQHVLLSQLQAAHRQRFPANQLQVQQQQLMQGDGDDALSRRAGSILALPGDVGAISYSELPVGSLWPSQSMFNAAAPGLLSLPPRNKAAHDLGRLHQAAGSTDIRADVGLGYTQPCTSTAAAAPAPLSGALRGRTTPGLAGLGRSAEVAAAAGSDCGPLFGGGGSGLQDGRERGFPAPLYGKHQPSLSALDHRMCSGGYGASTTSLYQPHPHQQTLGAQAHPLVQQHQQHEARAGLSEPKPGCPTLANESELQDLLNELAGAALNGPDPRCGVGVTTLLSCGNGAAAAADMALALVPPPPPAQQQLPGGDDGAAGVPVGGHPDHKPLVLLPPPPPAVSMDGLLAGGVRQAAEAGSGLVPSGSCGAGERPYPQDAHPASSGSAASGPHLTSSSPIIVSAAQPTAMPAPYHMGTEGITLAPSYALGITAAASVAGPGGGRCGGGVAPTNHLQQAATAATWGRDQRGSSGTTGTGLMDIYDAVMQQGLMLDAKTASQEARLTGASAAGGDTAGGAMLPAQPLTHHQQQHFQQQQFMQQQQQSQQQQAPALPPHTSQYPQQQKSFLQRHQQEHQHPAMGALSPSGGGLALPRMAPQQLPIGPPLAQQDGGGGVGSVAGGGPPYIPRDHMSRVTLKLMNCLPDELPPALRANLQRWVSGRSAAEVLQACMRPGCLELVVDVVHTGTSLEFTSCAMAHGNADRARHAINRVVTERLAADNELVLEVGGLVLIAPPGSQQPGAICTWEQAAGRFAAASVDKVKRRAVAKPAATPAGGDRWSGGEDDQPGLAPPTRATAAADDAASVPGPEPGECGRWAQPAIRGSSLVAVRSARFVTFTLYGEGLTEDDVDICGRMGGQNLRVVSRKLAPLPSRPAQKRAGGSGAGAGHDGAAGSGASEGGVAAVSRVAVLVQPVRQGGMMVLEPRRGRLLGQWWPVLVVPEQNVAGELNAMAAEVARRVAAAAGEAEEEAAAAMGSDAPVYDSAPDWLICFLADLGQVLDWVGWQSTGKQGYAEAAADCGGGSSGTRSTDLSGSDETWGSGVGETAQAMVTAMVASAAAAGGEGARAVPTPSEPQPSPAQPHNVVSLAGTAPTAMVAPIRRWGPEASSVVGGRTGGGAGRLAWPPSAAAAAAAAAAEGARLGAQLPASEASRDSAAATVDGSWIASYESGTTFGGGSCSVGDGVGGHGRGGCGGVLGRRPGDSDGDGSGGGGSARALTALRDAEINLELRLSFKTCRLLAFCVVRGLVATASLLRSLLAVRGMSTETVLGHALYGGEGLLMCAVRSRSRAMAEALLASDCGSWVARDVARIGPSGLSPLHVAATLPGGLEVAAALLTGIRGAVHHWFLLRGACGSTPAHLAAQFGNGALNQLAWQVLQQTVAGAGAGAAWPAVPAAGRSYLSSPPPPQQQGQRGCCDITEGEAEEETAEPLPRVGGLVGPDSWRDLGLDVLEGPRGGVSRELLRAATELGLVGIDGGGSGGSSDGWETAVQGWPSGGATTGAYGSGSATSGSGGARGSHGAPRARVLAGSAMYGIPGGGSSGNGASIYGVMGGGTSFTGGMYGIADGSYTGFGGVGLSNESALETRMLAAGLMQALSHGIRQVREGVSEPKAPTEGATRGLARRQSLSAHAADSPDGLPREVIPAADAASVLASGTSEGQQRQPATAGDMHHVTASPLPTTPATAAVTAAETSAAVTGAALTAAETAVVATAAAVPTAAAAQSSAAALGELAVASAEPGSNEGGGGGEGSSQQSQAQGSERTLGSGGNGGRASTSGGSGGGGRNNNNTLRKLKGLVKGFLAGGGSSSKNK